MHLINFFTLFSLQKIIALLASWRIYRIIHLILRPFCGGPEGKAVSSMHFFKISDAI